VARPADQRVFSLFRRTSLDHGQDTQDAAVDVLLHSRSWALVTAAPTRSWSRAMVSSISRTSSVHSAILARNDLTLERMSAIGASSSFFVLAK
jgi:hypothetical protein